MGQNIVIYVVSSVLMQYNFVRLHSFHFINFCVVESELDSELESQLDSELESQLDSELESQLESQARLLVYLHKTHRTTFFKKGNIQGVLKKPNPFFVFNNFWSTEACRTILDLF